MKEQWNHLLETYIQPLANDPQFTLYASIVGSVILVAFMLLFAARRSGRSIRVFDNQAGHIDVSNKALYELINSACNQVPAVHKPRVRFNSARTKLSIIVKFKLAEGNTLPEISAVLQNQIKQTLQDTLSIQKTILVNPMVTGFVPATKSHSNMFETDSSSHAPNEEPPAPTLDPVLPAAPPSKEKSPAAESADWNLYAPPTKPTATAAPDTTNNKIEAESPSIPPADDLTNPPKIPEPTPKKKKRSLFGFGSKKTTEENDELADLLDLAAHDASDSSDPSDAVTAKSPLQEGHDDEKAK